MPAIEKVEIITVQLLNAPDKVFSVEQWVAMGKYKGFLKAQKLLVKEVTGIAMSYMNSEDFKGLGI